MREIMDVISPSSPVQEIVFQKPTQIGGSEAILNLILYIMDIAPAPALFVMPTLDLVQQFSRQKLAPSIADLPRLKGKIKEPRSRDSANTLSLKEYVGGVLFLAGSNSAASFRSKSVRYVLLDDVDGFEQNVCDEGSPIELAKRRADTFGARRKIVEISTPTLKGVSHIERSFLESDQRYYHVPCPHCGTYQRLEWGGEGADFGLKFTRDAAGKVVDAWYECRSCHRRIDEHHKTDMLERGQWIPTFPERLKRGYQLSSLYSPLGWVSWNQIVKEFLEAKAYKERLKTWTNTRLAEVFEETGDQPEWGLLKARCEPYEPLTVPAGGLLLTAGVDTQDNRLAIVIRAWGKGEESWLIFWGELYGDPGQPQIWTDLETLLNYPRL